MAEATLPPSSGPGAPAPTALIPVVRMWRRLSSSLVPVLAVLTALITTIPLMILTGGEGDVGRGLRLAGTAYSSLLEGSLGVAFNPMLDEDDVAAALLLAEAESESSEGEALNSPITRPDLLRLSSRAEIIVLEGEGTVRNYGDTINTYLGTDALPDEESFTALGERIPTLQEIGANNLRQFEQLILALNEQERREVSALGREYGERESLTDEDVAAIVAFEPVAAEYEADDLRDFLVILGDNSIVALTRMLEQLAVLDALELDPNDRDARDIAAIVELAAGSDTGVARVIELNEVMERLSAAGIGNIEQLSNQLRLTLRLYDAGLVSNQNIAVALREELPPALEANNVVLRPKNRVLVDPGNTGTSAIIYGDSNTPDDPDDDVPEVAYLRAFGGTFLFFPDNLEETLTRSIPFVIAGLAVALGFKAGLFNIGAEGQLYIGATLAAWVGFASPWSDTPRLYVAIGIVLIAFLGFAYVRFRPKIIRPVSLTTTTAQTIQIDTGRIRLIIGGIVGAVVALLLVFGSTSLFHIMLMLLAGILGGALWGFIPGALKAFTGAHEVISTIMLNFVAIRFVDWLIKSSDPVILRDMEASAPRTPFIFETAQLPNFDTISLFIILAAGVLTTGLMLYNNRDKVFDQPTLAIGPVLWGVLVVLLGLFLQWINVRGTLHVGLILMVFTVWLVDWFLERTTMGFELRTVGANQDAAQYAGMSVAGNIVLALTLSGALVGLAGTIQISGVQLYMEPDFFSGLGFDSIAVALLARNVPRNMIAAGILWGGLLTGSGLMQERAELSSDLVKIIQALIIMFIAADAIVRYLYRVPEDDGRTQTTFSAGWGG